MCLKRVVVLGLSLGLAGCTLQTPAPRLIDGSISVSSPVAGAVTITCKGNVTNDYIEGLVFVLQRKTSVQAYEPFSRGSQFSPVTMGGTDSPIGEGDEIAVFGAVENHVPLTSSSQVWGDMAILTVPTASASLLVNRIPR